MELIKIDGLTINHSILLIFGCLLCLIGIIALTINLLNNKSINQALKIIVISVIFIGFPGIKKFSFMKDLVSIETWSEEVAKDPSNEQARENLNKSILEVDTDLVYSSKNLTSIAFGNTLTGNYSEGQNLSERALVKDINYTQAQNVKILTETSLLIEKVMLNPEETQLRPELLDLANQLEREEPSSNNFTSSKLAVAYLLGGDPDKALVKANEILVRDPSRPEASRIKELAKVEIEIKNVQMNPDDTDARNILQERINSAENQSVGTAVQSSTFSRAYRTLGNTEKANSYKDSTQRQIRNSRIVR